MMYAACTTPKSKTSHGISTPRPGKALIILLWMEGFIRFIPIIIGFQPYKVMQDFATIHSIIPQFAKITTSPVDQLKPKKNCWISSYFCWSSWCLESSLSNMIYPARLRLETQTKWYIYPVGKGPKADLKLKMQQETGYIWLLRWWIASMRLIIIFPRTKCPNSGQQIMKKTTHFQTHQVSWHVAAQPWCLQIPPSLVSFETIDGWTENHLWIICW